MNASTTLARFWSRPRFGRSKVRSARHLSRASLSRGDDHGSVRNLPSARHVVGVHHRTAHLGRIFSPDLPTSRRVFAALFELHFVTFVGLGLIGLLILLCTVNIDAEGPGVIAGPVTPGLLDLFLRARDNATSSERAHRVVTSRWRVSSAPSALF